MEISYTYNFFNTLIFSGIIYGLVYVSILLKGIKKDSIFLYLLGTILCLTLSNLQYWLIDVGIEVVPDIFYIQFELLILPFFYLFVQRYLQIHPVKGRLIVFIPFVLGMLYQFYINLWNVSNDWAKKYNLLAEILTILFNVFVIAHCILIISKYQRNSSRKGLKVSTNWLKYSIYIGIALCFFWILSTYLFYQEKEAIGSWVFYPLWIGISVLIFFIGQKGLVEFSIYKERSAIKKKKKGIESKSDSNKHVQTTDTNNSKSHLKYLEILRRLEDEQLYLNPNLSLKMVAECGKISPAYLSQLFSRYSKENFNETINKLRVKEAKRMLMDSEYNKYSISAIALESGFNSRSNFYASFKKQNQISPAEFKKSL